MRSRSHLLSFPRLSLASLLALLVVVGGLPAAPLLADEGGAEPAPAAVLVPADMGVDSLPDRRAAQLATASAIGVFHGFSFSDRREASGITFHHQIVDDAGPNYKAVHYDHGNGVAAADVDGDGLTDLYFTSQVGANELWKNLGDGSFRDITEAAGVAMAEPIGVSAAFADVDNDGDPDLFATSVRTGNRFFLNDGEGHFSDRTEAAGLAYSGHSSAPTFFDYDGDGLLDLFLANVGVYTSDERGRAGYYVGLADAFKGHTYPERAERSILYRNLGDGRFADVSEATLLVDRSWSGDATPLDFDGDGDLDLYVLSMQGPDHYYENVEGRFFVDRTSKVFPVTPPGSMGVKAFDWNRDGHLDLLLTDMHSDMAEDIGPELEKAKARTPAGVADAAIFGNALFEGGEDGFRERSDEVGAENYWPWGVSVDDLNADGWDDAFVTASMNYPFRYAINSVLLNDRGTTFRDAEFILGVEPRRGELTKPWFEVDCSAEGGEGTYSDEGWEAFGGGHHEGETGEPADAATTTDEGGPAKPVHPACEGHSGRIVVHAAKGSRGSVIFDLDGDGDLDIVTNEFFDHPQVLVSDLASQRSIHWLAVELEGRASNRDGFGASVTVSAAGSSQTKVHDGKSGYLAQSDLPLYFGLGADADEIAIDEITVRWPSGAVQTLPGPLAADRTLRIVEPAEPSAPGGGVDG